MSDTRACPICGNENWDGRRCLNCGYAPTVKQANTVKVRYVTKGGEVLYTRFTNEYGYSFDKFFLDRMQHEGGFFHYKGGRISADALLRIEVVEE